MLASHEIAQFQRLPHLYACAGFMSNVDLPRHREIEVDARSVVASVGQRVAPSVGTLTWIDRKRGAARAAERRLTDQGIGAPLQRYAGEKA